MTNAKILKRKIWSAILLERWKSIDSLLSPYASQNYALSVQGFSFDTSLDKSSFWTWFRIQLYDNAIVICIKDAVDPGAPEGISFGHSLEWRFRKKVDF